MLINRGVSSCKCCFQILHFMHYSTATSTNDTYSKYMSDSFGFSRQQALSISAKLTRWRKNNKLVDSNFIENANSVVALFHNLGFHQTHIRIVVSKQPRLLASNVEFTLKPKFRALQDQDFSQSHIIRLISKRPKILVYGLESTILPVIQIIKQVMGSVDNVINVIERLSESCFCIIVKYLLPNVALLSSGYGVSIELIRKELFHRPWYFVQDLEALMRADKKLRIIRLLPMSLYDSNLIFGMREGTFESKCQIFMSFGWTQSDIETFILKNGRRYAFSDESIKKKLDFLMNELRLKPPYLKSHNSLLTCSLEKRIVPRHKILLILKEMGLLEYNPSLYTAIKMSEPCFLKRFVLPFKEVHQAYAKLTGFSVQMPVQIPAQESVLIISTTNSYANYLVNYLGFSRQQSLSISAKLTQRRKKVNDFHFVTNAESVVTLFHNLGFNGTLIRNIVSNEPHTLASDVDTTLKPKIMVLLNENLSASDVVRVISRCPSILRFGSESTILPAIHMLKQVMGSAGNVVYAIERFSKWRFHAIVKCLLPNISFLSYYGVPIELIRKQIIFKPNCYVRNPEVFKDIVMRVENRLGITRDSLMFLYGVNLMCGTSEETFESKCEIFKSFQWTQSDVETFVAKNISCFTFSDESFKKKLDFLMNELQLKPAYLTSHNVFITCSLEKRIVPRHEILLSLQEKGLLKKKPPSLHSAIKMSERCFLKRFVLPFREVHEVYANHFGYSLKMLTQDCQETAVSFS